MKKFFLVALLALSCNIFGQGIITDENLENHRKIQTDYYPIVKKGLAEIPMSLVYFKYLDSSLSHYSLVVELNLGSTNQSLPKGSKLYIKLENGEIIEGTSMFEIHEFENRREWMDMFGYYYYYMYPQYQISVSDIEKMLENKVVKVRVQLTWGTGYFDLPNKSFKDKHFVFSNSLMIMKSAIDQRINKATNQEDLLRGF